MAEGKGGKGMTIAVTYGAFTERVTKRGKIKPVIYQTQANLTLSGEAVSPIDRKAAHELLEQAMDQAERAMEYNNAQGRM
jgi:hypothetical protein